MHDSNEAREVTFEHDVVSGVENEESSLSTQLCYLMLGVTWTLGSGTYSTLWKPREEWHHKDIIVCSGSCNGKTEREEEEMKAHCKQPRRSMDPNQRQLEAINIGSAVMMFIFGRGQERP